MKHVRIIEGAEDRLTLMKNHREGASLRLEAFRVKDDMDKLIAEIDKKYQ